MKKASGSRILNSKFFIRNSSFHGSPFHSLEVSLFDLAEKRAKRPVHLLRRGEFENPTPGTDPLSHYVGTGHVESLPVHQRTLDGRSHRPRRTPLRQLR